MLKKWLKVALLAVTTVFMLAVVSACSDGNDGGSTSEIREVVAEYESDTARLVFYKEPKEFEYYEEESALMLTVVSSRLVNPVLKSRGTYEGNPNVQDSVICKAYEGFDEVETVEITSDGLILTMKGAGPITLSKVSEPDDSGTPNEQTYKVGSIVKIGSVDYLVVKNTDTPNAVASKNPDHHYYPNERADAYRDHLIEVYGISEPYVIVFNTETEKEIPTASSYWRDIYVILREGKEYSRITYYWGSGNDGLDEDTLKNATADELRQGYDPVVFHISVGNPRQVLYVYAFSYENDRKTVIYDDDRLVQIETHDSYVYVNKRWTSQWAFYDRIRDKALSYKLSNPNNNTTTSLFDLRLNFMDSEKTVPSSSKPYVLYADTKGTINDDTTANDYRNTLTIHTCQYTSAEPIMGFTVQTKINNVTVANVTYVVEYDAATKKYSVLSNDNKSGEQYVSFSGETKTVNSMEVPVEITFSVPFAYEGAELNDFSKVTFVPQAEGADTVIYVPKEGEDTPYDFIDKFKKGYDIFGEWSLTRS